MNKKLLVLALVGAFSAPAMADVTINGTINMGPQIGTSTDATAVGQSNAVAASNGGQGFSTNGLTSNYSNVNQNSTEDIGDGNKATTASNSQSTPRFHNAAPPRTGTTLPRCTAARRAVRSSRGDRVSPVTTAAMTSSSTSAKASTRRSRATSKRRAMLCCMPGSG